MFFYVRDQLQKFIHNQEFIQVNIIYLIVKEVTFIVSIRN